MIENVANAFNFLQQFYDETATLVHEIEGLLSDEPECFMIGRPSGYGISTRGSTGLEQQNVNRWLTKRFAVFFIPEHIYKRQSGQTVTTLPTENVMYMRFLLDGYNSFTFSGKPIDAPSILFGVLHKASCPNGKKKKFEQMMVELEYLESKLLRDLPKVNLNEASVEVSGTLQIVPLLTLTDPKAVNDNVVQPLVEQWRQVGS